MRKQLSLVGTLASLLVLAGQLSAPAKPVSREEGQRQSRVLEQLRNALAAETTAATKFAHIERVMKAEQDVDLRRRILDMATRIPGADLEKFLTRLLAREQDAGLRSQAATILGRMGSEKCLTTLAQVARNDPTTYMMIGCIRGRSSARRAAIFAIAELAGRFPQLADQAAAELRALPVVADAKDNEWLAEARMQALYQVTQDKALLKPFYEQLHGNDAHDRGRGVLAFRFLKLKEAPAEIVNALKDPSPGVRSSAATVLGVIRDPKTGPALMDVAGDTKEDAVVRIDAIDALGRMKSAAAANLMERLLIDTAPNVPVNAAIALYRITGKKVKQFPEGYRAD